VRMIGSVLDITRHKQAEENIRQLIHYDPLTRLPNRNMARLQLENLLAAGHGPVGVLILDLDRFKEINDSDGHDIGDEVLVQLAQALQPLAGPGATLARVGGDSFMVLLPGTAIEGAVAMAEQLLRGVEQPLQVLGRPLFLRASIGVAVSPEDGQDPAELIRHAEIAMYEAKTAGGHRYGMFRR
jgi:diguanylate cyclase (GGDEF)-like protein